MKAYPALIIQKEIGIACRIVTSDFENSPLSREFSDWNDYVRENGVKATREAIQKALEEKQGT